MENSSRVIQYIQLKAFEWICRRSRNSSIQWKKWLERLQWANLHSQEPGQRPLIDKHQKQLLSVMLSSGDLVLQLINDILDLSKVESGVMKLEATKFRPREVIKHVLQTAAASLKKMLILEGHVSDDVPVEVIGDVLRIRQILTNLISNAIKFTHQGKVEINLYVVADPHPEGQQEQKMENDGTSVAHGLNYIHQDKQMMMHRDINSANVFLCENNCHILQDFLARKLAPLPGDYPTLNDWENHLTTIFPEVRLKRYLEMRGADGGPWRRLCALPAFWVGILYDDISLQNVLDMTADWTTAEREMLRNKVPVTGLKTPFRDGLLKHVAEEVLTFAKDGLDRRGYKETGFLNEVAEVVRTGLTPAEKLLDLYHGKWGQNVDPVFEELLY